MTQRPIKVIVVDDHEAIRLGVATALRREYVGQVVVTGAFRNVGAALASGVVADVVLLDLQLGDDSDPQANVEALVEHGYRVLVYSVADNVRLMRRALAGGADGVCRKAEPLRQTLDSILEVAAGRTVLSQEVLATIEGDADYVAANLGPRERQVLSLYAAGLEIHEVAHRLYITENSVKEYLKRIRAKYTQIRRPAGSKLDLYKRAVEDGIVPPVEPKQ